VKSTLYHRPWYGTIGYPIGTLLDKKWNLTAKEGFSLKQISRVDRKIVDDRVAGFRKSVQRQRENSRLLRSLIQAGSSILPLEKEECRSNFFQFAIRFAKQSHRDEVATYMWEHGIDSARYLDDIAEFARKAYGYNGDCPVAERCAKTVLSIPNHYTIASGTIERIARVVSDGIREKVN
jgi:dTDP-4-amino-4,6-dideoxygalactose transaminase